VDKLVELEDADVVNRVIWERKASS